MSLLNLLPARNRELLPEFGMRYLQHILAEYATLPPELGKNIPATVQAILNAATLSPPESMTWGDLFVLEKTMLAIQPESTVRRRARDIRDAYRELFGQRQYEVYMASKPPNENESTIDDVRADMDRLLDALYRRYALSPIREIIPIRKRMRNELLRPVVVMFWSSVVLLILAGWSAQNDQTLVATLLIMMLAGAMGAFMSLLRRIQDRARSGDSLTNIFEAQNGVASLYLAPISGAIFAVILYLIFLGKLMSGVIFPDVTNFHLWWGPVHWEAPYSTTASDFAKLVLWAFIAGFAERFVPDTLDQLASRGREAQHLTEMRTVPPPPFAPGP
jgi:hypothetical protein